MLRFGWGLALWLLLAIPVRAQVASPAANGAKLPDADSRLPFTPQRYELKARLDPAKKQVHGTGRITFTNTSPHPLEALLFHLYLNAFRDDESVFMRESGGFLRGQASRGDGKIELQSLVVAGHDALARAEHELIPRDRTQLRVPLDEPLPPGATLVIELGFVSTLPPVFARTGHARDFFAVGQWFPKLAKLDADGFVGFPYHALGEFYADFADYTLELEAPSDYALVASGTLIEETQQGDRTRHRYRAECVHDVAFMAGRSYRVDVESIDGVMVRYLAPPGYDAALAQHAEVVRAGLRHFGEQFGAYPYPTLSVVVPPRDAPGAMGMEYPTLFTTGGSWLPLPGLPSLGGAVVTAHELAHQWFQGMLASDELHHPVLDEGLTEWASLDLMRTLYGPREGLGALTFDRYEIERALAVRASGISPGMPANEYESNEYATSIYARASAALETIRRAYGASRFTRALGVYARRHRFKHPTPDDLSAAFDAIYGPGFAERVLQPLLFEGATSEVRITSARSRWDVDDYLTHVRARRRGVALPTWLAVYGMDGKVLARAPWLASDDELRLDVHTRAKVARVELDPDHALLLDPDRADHEVVLRPVSSSGLLGQLLAASQLVLGWLGP